METGNWGNRPPMALDQTKRKLAAILAADIAGYSRLMGADEEGTLSRLKLLSIRPLLPA
jgi:class 3 adenylate cyclase